MANPSSRYDLTGRTALVTGAGGLLGKQHVAALAEAGARVVVTDVGLAQAEAAVAMLKQATPAAELIALDINVTSLESVRAAGEQLASRDVTVDIDRKSVV